MYAPQKPQTLEVKRVVKPKKQEGGGVSWRAFSESRTEQRTTELEAIQSALRQRGKSISFGSHALTDDGRRVPIIAPTEQQIFGNGNAPRPRNRGVSPPRRKTDVEPTADEIEDGGGGVEKYDPKEYKTNPFTG